MLYSVGLQRVGHNLVTKQQPQLVVVTVVKAAQDKINPAIVKVMGFPGGSEAKASASSAGDLGLIPGSGRSPGGGNGNPLQYSCLENPMDGGAW